MILSRFSLAIFLCALLGVHAGCNSIYHRASRDLPAGIESRLAMRVKEAQRSAQGVFTRISGRGPAAQDEIVEHAWDFSRRVASVRDVVSKMDSPGPEVQRMMDALEQAEVEVAAAVGSNGWPQASDALSTAIAESGRFLEPLASGPVRSVSAWP